MQKHCKTQAKRGGVRGEARLKRASGSPFAAKTLELSVEISVGQRMQKNTAKHKENAQASYWRRARSEKHLISRLKACLCVRGRASVGQRTQKTLELPTKIATLAPEGIGKAKKH